LFVIYKERGRNKIRRRKYDLLVAGLGSAEKETVKAGLAIG
jgi:hypothetical protein